MAEDDLATKVKIFISYSRKDKDFVRKLHEALVANGFETWVDWEGIRLGTDWWQEIVEGIQDSDQFLLVISPDSVDSDVCADEVQTAIGQGKRLVPLVIREEKGMVAKVRSEVQKINFTFMRSDEEFDKTLPALVDLLNTDLAHLKQHTQLQGRALDWERRNRSNSMLLRGDALEQAEAWQVQASGKNPARTPLQAEFIQVSRKDATRRQRWFLGGVSVALVIMVVLAIASAIGFRDARLAQATALANEHKANTQQVLAELSAETAVANQIIAATEQARAELNEAIALTEEAKAEEQRAEAEEQRARAEEKEAEANTQKEIAQARELASQAMASLPQGNLLTRSILLTINSLRNFPNAQADQALRQGLDLLPARLDQLDSGEAVRQAAYSPDGEWLVVVNESGLVRVFNAASLEETAQLPHAAAVNEIAFHPADPALLATAGADGTAVLWNIATGGQIAVMEHEGAVNAVAFSSSGLWLATGAEDGLARTWTLTTYRPMAATRHNGPVRDVAFSPGGAWVVSVSEDRTARVWAATSGAVAHNIYHASPVNLVAFHPTDFIFLTASSDGGVFLWDGVAGSQIHQFSHEEEVTGAVFNAAGSRIATASRDGTGRVWDAATGLPILRLQHDRDVLAIAWSPDGSLLATASADNTARLWDANTGREAARMEHGEAVNRVAFHRNGYIVATASADHMVSIWSDEQVGQAVHTLYYEPGFKDLDFNADETLLATATLDQQVLVWNVAEERVVLAIAVGTEIIDVDYSRDGTLIATAGEDGRACIWDAVSGEQVVCFQHQGAVQDADWSRDGSFLITSAHDGTVRFWSVQAQGELRRFNQPGPANEASLHPDGTFLAVSTTANAALIWDAATGELVFTLPHPAPVNLIGIRADENWVITVAADNTLRIWDLATGALVDKFINDTNLLSLEVGPDGSTIATAAEDNIARIRDFATAEEIARIVHTDRINDVTFVADGQFLATASGDGRVLISILEPEELIDKACSRLTRNLTADEWNEFVHGLYEKTCPNLPPDPQAIASLLAEAGNAGTRGETDLGLALLEHAQSLDSSLTFDVETELVLLTQEAFIRQALEFLHDGHVRNALVKLHQIQARYPDLDTDPYRELLASLCQAVEAESAEDLLEACTAGIQLETAAPALRLLYTGRARQAAALGRLPEAASDLEAALSLLARDDFPDQESYNQALAELQGYLQSLEAGANPFED